MNLGYGLSLHEFSVAQVDSAPAWCSGVIGSNPVGDADFFFVHTPDMLINSFSQLFSNCEHLLTDISQIDML